MKRSTLLKILSLALVAVPSSSCADPSERPMRVLTAGIAHESNTFIPTLTTEDHFRIRRGPEALEDQEWAQYLEKRGVEIIPTTHAAAGPFGVVDKATYVKLKSEILEGARNAGTIDGIYLQMHGAMHVEGFEDAQVDLVKSLREICGEDVLISASFDLHGSISPEFMAALDLMTAYRTAPHVDGAETRLRAVQLLYHALSEGLRPGVEHINVPILIPGEKGITAVEPLKSLYESLPKIAEKEGLLDASIFVGMPWTDIPRAGMSVQVVAANPESRHLAQEEAVRLAQAVWDVRHLLKFDVPTASIDDAIQIAMDAPESTVFITDSGDNTTAGAAGDNPLVLERLLTHGVTDAVFAGIYDPEAVQVCIEAGQDASVELVLGGKMDNVFGAPLPVSATVVSLPESATSETSGRMPVVVDVGGNLVVILNERRSFISPADFEEVGIDPLAHKIVVVKLGYLFQGLRDIAPRTIMALTPGFAYQVVENLPYKNIRRPIYPIDAEMNWTPELSLE